VTTDSTPLPFRPGLFATLLGFASRSAAKSFVLLSCGILCPLAVPQQTSEPSDNSVQALHQAFAHPPDDARIMMRWWWFGPAATKPELKRELEQMKAAGIGGVEIATLYPLALDNPETGFHNYPFVSAEHIENLRYAAEQARQLGLRVDITLGSGWPFGGPDIPVTQAAGELRSELVPIPPGARSVPVPPLEHGEKILAAFIAPDSDSGPDLEKAKMLPWPSGARLDSTDLPAGKNTVVFFISSRTGMMVKRPAVGASGFVLDHYDQAAIQNHLHAVGDPLLSAFGDHPPYAVFSDSLEDYGSDWTPNLLSEFQRRRGYDLLPFLPTLIGDAGPDTPAVRHDWGQTLTELANEQFLEPIHGWAKEHHTLFRSQTYGFPPVTLSSNRYEDLPEGEGKATVNMWRDFSDTRWAASAGHLFNHTVISSETWTWLHSPAFRATPLDMKAEADLHFLQGINQLIGHGWPYSPEAAGEPGWRMYAAGAFNAHNPWFAVMPDLTKYLQRVSFALRQGKPENDVALLLPDDDVWASFKARIQQNKSATSLGGFDETGSNVTIDESMSAFLGHEVIPQILDAGFNLDFIDADAIDTVGIPYKVLILPNVDRISPATYEKIFDFARRGGIVIATRRLPGTAPGHVDAQAISTRVQTLSETLFHGQIATAHFVANERDLGASLASWSHPDFVVTPKTPEIGFIHRHLDSGDLYFVANTSHKPHKVQASFRSTSAHVELWDPFTGETESLTHPNQIDLDLQPYESRIIFFSNTPLSAPAARRRYDNKQIDISHDWQVNLGNATFQMANLTSWTERPEARFFSGSATYQKTIEMPGIRPGQSVALDFGEGTPVAPPDSSQRFNMRAYLDSPVRDAAQVYVNDQFAGYVWHPPFRVDISKYLKSGKNDLRIVVANTAINSLAGRSQPNYRLLYDRYGVEFIPQGMQDLQPLPSGILGSVNLIESSSTK
jgi:alpha-L-rhamnosidase